MAAPSLFASFLQISAVAVCLYLEDGDLLVADRIKGRGVVAQHGVVNEHGNGALMDHRLLGGIMEHDDLSAMLAAFAHADRIRLRRNRILPLNAVAWLLSEPLAETSAESLSSAMSGE